MIKKQCSFCNGKGILGERIEATEIFLAELLDLEPEIPHAVICPKCQGTGIEIEVELQDFCKVGI